jgi:hypothetical protein
VAAGKSERGFKYPKMHYENQIELLFADLKWKPRRREDRGEHKS